MKEIKVKNVIIGKQFDESENMNEFIQIVKEKKINIMVVQKGNKVNVEKEIYFDVLWPSKKQEISDNSINNSALVCKLNYMNFSMLFTGDIEEESENILVSEYKNTSFLKSTILKVAHHGSKTSSTDNFLNLVKPQIAVIGVGINNLYGHPNKEVLERLRNISCNTFRTDKDGEIEIVVNKKGNIKVAKFIN